MPLLTSQSTILFKNNFSLARRARRRELTPRGDGTKMVVVLPLNQESILIT